MKTTRPFVEQQLANLNRLTGSPSSPYTHTVDGIVPSAGCFFLDSAYGGYSLRRMSSTPGSTGENTVTNRGYASLKEISNIIHVYAQGYTDALYAMQQQLPEIKV